MKMSLWWTGGRVFEKRKFHMALVKLAYISQLALAFNCLMLTSRKDTCADTNSNTFRLPYRLGRGYVHTLFTRSQLKLFLQT